MSKALRWFGNAWLAIGLFIILAAWINTLNEDGAAGLVTFFLPPVGKLAMIALLTLPGIGLRSLGKRLQRNQLPGQALGGKLG